MFVCISVCICNAISYITANPIPITSARSTARPLSDGTQSISVFILLWVVVAILMMILVLLMVGIFQIRKNRGKE